MIGLPSNTRVWIVAGHTDMRKGFDGLAALVQTTLQSNPFCGHVFVFRGRRGDIIKVLWFDGQGLMLLAKRLERGRFVWPQASSGSVYLTPAQLSMLLEGIDWRMPLRTDTPRYLQTVVGTIVRINQRTATVDPGDGTTWRVGFALLRPVVDI